MGYIVGKVKQAPCAKFKSIPTIISTLNCKPKMTSRRKYAKSQKISNFHKMVKIWNFEINPKTAVGNDIRKPCTKFESIPSVSFWVIAISRSVGWRRWRKRRMAQTFKYAIFLKSITFDLIGILIRGEVHLILQVVSYVYAEFRKHRAKNKLWNWLKKNTFGLTACHV